MITGILWGDFIILRNDGLDLLLCQWKDLEKNILELRKILELPRTLTDVHKRMKDKPVTHGIRNWGKKGRTRSSEYHNTKIWRKKLHQKILVGSRIWIV